MLVCTMQARFVTENMGRYANRIADDRFREMLIKDSSTSKWLRTELQSFLKKYFAEKLQAPEQSIRSATMCGCSQPLTCVSMLPRLVCSLSFCEL
jgi:hypothetical protein